MLTTPRPYLLLLTIVGLAAAVAIAGALALGASEARHPRLAATPRAPVTEGGLVYRSMGARTLERRNPVDRRILRGVPAARDPLPRDQAWFGVFLTAANPGRVARPSSRGLSLVDVDGRRFLPEPLPRGQRYAYRPTIVRPGREYPGADSVAARDLAAEGALVLFRIPRSAYRDGTLALLVTDPAGHEPPAPIAVS